MKSTSTVMLKQFLLLHLAVNIIIHSTIHGVVANLYKAPQNHKNPNELSLRESHVVRREAGGAYQPKVDNLEGMPGQGYYIEVAIGTPPQKLNVLIDTGSSNFAVACEDHEDISTFFRRERSSTYVSKGRHVSVPYTQGKWDGELGIDYVSIPSLFNSTVLVNIACITEATEFYINGSHWQGILGLGYAAIARPDSTVEPLFDTLLREGKVENTFTVELCGAGFKSAKPDVIMGGSLMFGRQQNEGNLFSTPINKEWYYEVVIVDIEVSGVSLAMDCKEYNFGKTIVDTGTTNLRLPSRVFTALTTALRATVKTSPVFKEPSSDFWSGDDLLCWPKEKDPYIDFPTITIVLPTNHTSAFKLVVSPQQYLRVIGPNEDVETTPGDHCYKLAIASSQSGSVIGAVILEGYDVVFDRRNKRLQFAVSPCNVIDDQAVRSSIVDSSVAYENYKDCAYAKADGGSRTLTIVGYVMAGLCGLCLLPLIILAVQWQYRRCQCGWKKLRRTYSDSNDLVDESR